MFWAEFFKAQEQTAMIVPSETREHAACLPLAAWLLCKAHVILRVVHGVQVRVIQTPVTLDHVV
jgi:hypothetical protein